jgi:hypothetical protein
VYHDKDGQDVSHFPRIPVKKNLAMFLDSLRAASRTVPYLWIDAIWINQSDRIERASQVSMMTDIYSRCTQVNVWLGSGHDSTTSTQRFFDIHTHAVVKCGFDNFDGDPLSLAAFDETKQSRKR